VSLAPLLAAPLSTQVHAFAAMAAFALGAVQLAAPKGTLPHRTIAAQTALMVPSHTSFWSMICGCGASGARSIVSIFR
jgi:uncharacterized membrane protein